MTRLVDPKRWERVKHFPAWLGLASIVVIAFLIVVSGIIACFKPSGGGESRESPNGKYDASAYNMSEKRIWGDRMEWDEIRVTEKQSGRHMWQVKRVPVAGVSPDYSMRGIKFVEWAEDSSAVVVDIGGGQKLTLPVQ